MTNEQRAIATELHDLNDGAVHEWLKAQLTSLLTAAMSCADETRLRWLQGKAQMLKQIIDGIESAADDIKQEREKERIERLKETLRPAGKMQGAF